MTLSLSSSLLWLVRRGSLVDMSLIHSKAELTCHTIFEALSYLLKHTNIGHRLIFRTLAIVVIIVFKFCFRTHPMVMLLDRYDRLISFQLLPKDTRSPSGALVVLCYLCCSFDSFAVCCCLLLFFSLLFFRPFVLGLRTELCQFVRIVSIFIICLK